VYRTEKRTVQHEEKRKSGGVFMGIRVSRKEGAGYKAYDFGGEKGRLNLGYKNSTYALFTQFGKGG